MKNLKHLATIISLLSNPALVLLTALSAIVWYYADTPKELWQGIGFGSLLLVGPGLLYAVWLWRKEGHIDVDLTDRQDRVVPLALSSLGAFIGGYLVSTTYQNETLALMSYILVAELIILTAVTTVWKISMHAATIAGLTTLIVIFRGDEFSFLYFLLLPVFWARLVLKQHTISQLLAGTAVGIVVIVVAANFFRV